MPVAEEDEAVCTSQPYVGAKFAITNGGAMCKCQTESCNARKAVQGSEKPRNPPQQKNRGGTGTPRGPPPSPQSLRAGGREREGGGTPQTQDQSRGPQGNNRGRKVI